MQDVPQTLKIATVWGLVFVAGFLGLQWWFANEKRSNIRIEASAAGQTVVIKRGRDGHYHWLGALSAPGAMAGARSSARLGATPDEMPGTAANQSKPLEVDFLIDTGATSTSISQELADKIGLKAFEKAQFSTANGSVTGSRTRADVRLEGGVQLERHNLAVMPRMDGSALLGMDILSKFKLEQSDQQLRITLPR